MQKIALSENNNVSSGRFIVFERLPFPPSSSMWKRSSMIRSTLVKILNKLGIGSCGSKRVHGQGYPPNGWPESVIPWNDFKGPSKSHLNNRQLTRIIIEILKAHGIDPETYVDDAEVKADVELENVTELENVMELENVTEMENDEVLVDGTELEKGTELAAGAVFDVDIETSAKIYNEYLMEVDECDIVDKSELESDVIVTVGKVSSSDFEVDIECSMTNV